MHGTGGQTRAFIHIQDTVKCLALAVKDPHANTGKVRIMNQMTETHTVRDPAQVVADVADVAIAKFDNPRKEAAENGLRVSNCSFRTLELEPITLENGLLAETNEIARRFAHLCDPAMIPCVSTWTDAQRPGVVPVTMTATAWVFPS